mmetsp:Transcript_11500/g.32590  ORF Transcript_11500/g.32590 Transcript_11500/m.32590 type:complete len:513 (+) Transcript_11500:72-1610(+)
MMTIRYGAAAASAAAVCACFCTISCLVGGASAFALSGTAHHVPSSLLIPSPSSSSALAAAASSKQIEDDRTNNHGEDIASSTSRRELFANAFAATSALSFLAIDASSPRSAHAADDTSTPASSSSSISSPPPPIRLSASWSATSGLNALDPSDPNFVSFDASAYAAMKNDVTRTPLFRKALQDRLNAAKGGPESQVVLDLGTGPFALFAIMAAELGAGRVYAIEANPEIARNARRVIAEQGFDEIITVLEGFSTDISLPDNAKADIIVAEIIGSIATEEGAYATILDAHKRLMKDPTDANNWIPSRIQTWAAPASYTLHNLFTPPEFDWTKIAAEPVRFSCRDYALGLLDDPQCVEDIRFADIDKLTKASGNGGGGGGGAMKKQLSYVANGDRIRDNEATFVEEYRKGGLPKNQVAELAPRAAHSCTGLALWPRLMLPGSDDAEEYVINSRGHPDGGQRRSHWQTVLPIMGPEPAADIRGGDRIEVTCEFEAPVGVTKAPRYSVVADVYASG